MDVTPQQQARLEPIDAICYISRATSQVCQRKSQASTVAGIATPSNRRYDRAARKIAARKTAVRKVAAKRITTKKAATKKAATKKIHESCTAEDCTAALSIWVQSFGHTLLGIVAFDHLGLPTHDWCFKREIAQQTVKTLFELLSLNLLLSNHCSDLGLQQHLVVRGNRNLVLVVPWEQGYLGAYFQGEIPSELISPLLSQLRLFTGFSTVPTQEVAA